MDALEKILYMQRQRGWTQRELAKRAHISQSTLSSLTRNHFQPTLPTLEALCQAFGITLAQFFAEDPSSTQLTDEHKELVRCYSMLTPSQQQAVLTLLKSML